MRLGFSSASTCPPEYVSTRTYTARGAAECNGYQVTVTRTFRTRTTQRFADDEALRLARCEAEAALAAAIRAGGLPVSPVSYFDNCAPA